MTNTNDISPIEIAKNFTPWWMERIWDFDALEIHPCAIIKYADGGRDVVEQCAPEDADFWTVFGHYREGGIDTFEDFLTEVDAQQFHDKLIAAYPHLTDGQLQPKQQKPRGELKL